MRRSPWRVLAPQLAQELIELERSCRSAQGRVRGVPVMVRVFRNQVARTRVE